VRVAHVAPNYGDSSSAAWRILNSQISIGMDAFGLVHNRKIDGPARQINGNLFGKSTSLMFARATSAFNQRFYYRTEQNSPWTTKGWMPELGKALRKNQPNVVNLHWLPSCIDLEDANSSVSADFVLTLHDVWPLTGGCHCSFDCQNWRIGCGECPQRTSRIPILISPVRDFQSKLNNYLQIDSLSVVGPSKWICEMAEESPMFTKRRVFHIPNCIDGRVFLPLPRTAIREAMNIDNDCQVLLFVVSGSLTQFHKGFDLLLKSLHVLSKDRDRNLLLMTVGDTSELKHIEIPIPALHLGQVSDELEMAKAYSAADVFLLPSRHDNYPNTVLEALSCGTRTVAFSVGGLVELLRDESRGKLIPPFDHEEFSKSIASVIDNRLTEEQRSLLHDDIQQDHSPMRCAEQYKMVYETIAT